MRSPSLLSRPLSAPMTGLAVAVGMGLLLSTAFLLHLRLDTERAPLVELDCSAAQREARLAVGRRVWTDHSARLMEQMRQRDAAALDREISYLESYFERARKGIRPFSRALHSRAAQWALVREKLAGLLSRCGRLPRFLRWRWLCAGASSLARLLDRHAFQKHVAALMERHLFSPEELRAVLRRAAVRFRRSLDEQDAALLSPFRDQRAVGDEPLAGHGSRDDRLRSSTSQDPGAQNPSFRASIASGSTLLAARRAAASSMAADLLQRLGGKLLVALAAHAINEGAVSLGLLSAGAASSLWSAGLGLGVALLSRALIRHALRMLHGDPREVVERRLTRALAAARQCAIEGCAQNLCPDGLRSRLERYGAWRRQVRAEALHRALVPL